MERLLTWLLALAVGTACTPMRSPVDAGRDGGPVDAPAAHDAPVTDDAPIGAPAAPVLRGPVRGYRTGSVWAPGARRPRFWWSAVEGASDYELVVDDSCAEPNGAGCAMASPEISERVAVTAFAPSADLAVSETPPVGRRYFSHVRACAATGACSAWSDTGYVDVGRLAGDYDGDGYAEVVVGASRWTGAAPREGRAVVWGGSADGLTTAPSCTIALAVSEADARYGSAIASAGDVNADGYDDLAVSAPWLDDGAVDAGLMHVLLGGASGVCGADPIVLRAASPEAGAELGDAVADAGDVDGDGYADLLVGARFADGASTDEGAALLFRGRAGGIEPSGVPIADPTPEPFGRFGAALAGLGDVDGDALADVAVTAPFAAAPLPESGRVHVFHGSSAGLVHASSHDNPDATSQSSFFGASVFGSDLDSDGLADLVVGSDEQAFPEGNEGNAFVFLGGVGHALSVFDVRIDNPDDQRAGRFGRAIAAGDFDRDGRTDLVVTAQYHEFPEADEGNAFVFSGAAALDGPPALRLDNPDDQPGARFGTAASATDVNGDGYADLIIGADRQASPATDEGNGFLYVGRPGGLRADPDLRLEDPDDLAGTRFGGALR